MAGNLRRMAGAYGAFTRAHVRRILEYRASFFLGFVALLARHVVGVLMLWVVFSHTDAIGSWTTYEVVYLYGFMTLVLGLHHLFLLNTFRLEFIVRDGELDRFLVRPLPPLYQLTFHYFDDDALGDLVPAVLLLVVASAHLDLAYTPAVIAIFISGVLGGVAIFFGIHLLLASWSFWFVKSRALIQLFSEGRRFSEYPLSIFSPRVQFFVTFVVPFACAAYFPAARVLGRDSVSLMAWASLPVGAICVAIGMAAWRVGIAHYQSTGS